MDTDAVAADAAGVAEPTEGNRRVAVEKQHRIGRQTFRRHRRGVRSGRCRWLGKNGTATIGATRCLYELIRSRSDRKCHLNSRKSLMP